jgi:S1-C subfamily serine protease
MITNYQNIRKQLNAAQHELMQRQNVVATGIGYKTVAGKSTPDLAIVCSVDSKKPVSKLQMSDIIPARIQNIPTDVKATGTFRAFNLPTGRFRPMPGGCSISHPEVSAGTLGCWVQKGDQLYLLSNNHVIANSNEANIGDVIIQPGSYDGGINPGDIIAELSDFIPIGFQEETKASAYNLAKWITSFMNGLSKLMGSQTRLKAYRIQQRNNKTDCAIAKPLSTEDIAMEILQIGRIEAIKEAELGMEIKKSGRTTGLTSGAIEQIDVTVSVSYGYNKTAVFTDQLLAGAMSQGGDSGSAVVDLHNNLVGLLYAGSETSTLINRIQNVFNELKITLPEKQDQRWMTTGGL